MQGRFRQGCILEEARHKWLDISQSIYLVTGEKNYVLKQNPDDPNLYS